MSNRTGTILALLLFAGIAPAKAPAAQGEAAEVAIRVGAQNETRMVVPGKGADPQQAFRDCSDCPDMVVVPAGEFMMGSPPAEQGHGKDEAPQHRVTIAYPFAIGKFEISRKEFEACLSKGRCSAPPSLEHMAAKQASRRLLDALGVDRQAADAVEQGAQSEARRDLANIPEDHPASGITWSQAQDYVHWLTEKTGKPYRLPTEAEWEYAARAGTVTPFWWGTAVSRDEAQYDASRPYGGGRAGDASTGVVAVDHFAPNPWGLHNVHGNVEEWVEDCFVPTYDGAPSDGSARTLENCENRVLRGGKWTSAPDYIRSAHRSFFAPNGSYAGTGFRVVRDLAD
jgi:formylglycine-generating enzyme required for sulfatase activity